MAIVNKENIILVGTHQGASCVTRSLINQLKEAVMEKAVAELPNRGYPQKKKKGRS